MISIHGTNKKLQATKSVGLTTYTPHHYISFHCCLCSFVWWWRRIFSCLNNMSPFYPHHLLNHPRNAEKTEFTTLYVSEILRTYPFGAGYTYRNNDYIIIFSTWLYHILISYWFSVSWFPYNFPIFMPLGHLVPQFSHVLTTNDDPWWSHASPIVP